jgi:hypothetical protein
MFVKKALVVTLAAATVFTTATATAQAGPASTQGYLCVLQAGTALTADPDPNSHIIWWAAKGDQIVNLDGARNGYDHGTDVGTPAHRITVPGWFPRDDMSCLIS